MAIDSKVSPARHRLEFPRFGLRTLFVVATVICVASAWVTERWRHAERQRQAVFYLEDLNFHVEYRHEYEVDGEWHVPTGQEYPTPQWFSRIVGRDFLGRVDYVSVSVYTDKQAIDDVALQSICQLVSLREIHLKGVRTSQMKLSRLSKLRHLESLVLDFTDIDDTQIAILGELKALKSLILSGTRITDESMPVLGQLDQLVTLDLSNTEISDEGLIYLQGSENLECLRIYRTRISSQGITKLREMLPKCEIQTQDPWDTLQHSD